MFSCSSSAFSARAALTASPKTASGTGAVVSSACLHNKNQHLTAAAAECTHVVEDLLLAVAHRDVVVHANLDLLGVRRRRRRRFQLFKSALAPAIRSSPLGIARFCSCAFCFASSCECEASRLSNVTAPVDRETQD